MENKGFTIIELVISIFVLSVAIVGIFTAFSVMTILTSDSADRLTAAYLAQEGMEIVRNIRDTNWLRVSSCAADIGDTGCTPAPTWLDGLDTICSSGCEVDYRSTNENYITPWSGSGRVLNINPGGFYFYDNMNLSPTKFKREVKVMPIADVDYAVKVLTQVSWTEKASVLFSANPAGDCGDNCSNCPTNCISAEETLFNWYK